MPPEFMQVVAQLGIAAVFLYQLNIVYSDGKTERAQLIADLKLATEELTRVKDRLTRIEAHLGIDDPPTLPKRPE